MFEIKENFSLKNYNTFGIDAKCRFFVECSSLDEITQFLENHNKSDIPLMILGGGSNVLFTQDFEGYVLRPFIKGIEIIEESEEDILVKVGAGEDWDVFVEYCVEKGWGGVENLSLIPGNVGTCPIQNIGAYGVEVKDVIEEVESLEIENLKKNTFKNAECAFGYRDSIFKRNLKGKQIITYVSFRLKKQPVFMLNYGSLTEELNKFNELSLKNIRKAVIDIRESKLPDPKEIGNSGSFFKNPVIEESYAKGLKQEYEDIPLYKQDNGTVKVPAGWLIEKAGWKGKRIGDAGVHEKQALVLVNYGNATGKEIFNLAQEIQQSVKTKFNINIEMEVNVV
ncbi:MAG: UDP-N-acetylmuramate dehydrogenase [Bacteroidales bacterium]|nr:UDP-N-acetylmuramate dehydrogenase [Bacteroidales bacterium]